VLSGFTYKLRWPGSDHSLYITINDIEERDGRRRPFEVFINTKNLEHYAWTVALTRMISAVFRRGGDVTFVVEELKAIFDPQGGQWMGGRYVPSLIAAIGEVIEQHMARTGFIAPRASGEETEEIRLVAEANSNGTKPDLSEVGRHCPRCNLPTLRHREGCLTCDSCGYSKCN
jgi:ribonucleoside-diphosphate reductase alpha chain